ncbi:nucleoside transporter C-terminal domain-containing protein [Oscillatoria amoena NRMC-F 0135]|nr:nucleoside transporter C-terminal domain-containing protein [Oscillatoria amoena NRMC-F 0135]
MFFFSALTSLLYYLGILQKVVYGIAWVMKKTMRLSGAESLAAAANVFVGQTEAPLVIKPYIPKMTRSEILCLMTGGMATIAGGVMSAFIGFLGGDNPEMQRFFATHLLTASLMSAPAAIVAAKLIVPETEEFDSSLKVNNEKLGTNILESISIGTTEGLKLAVNVGAMLLVFTALIYLLNSILIGVGDLTGLNEAIAAGTGGMYKELSFQFLLGHLFSPVAWLIGVNNNDIFTVGQLLGEKTILNEFYAYTSFGNLKNAGVIVDTKTIVITTYALCGFSNFASIGIQIGGIGSLAPDKRTLLSQLGLRALLGGTIACLLTAAIVGMFY